MAEKCDFGFEDQECESCPLDMMKAICQCGSLLQFMSVRAMDDRLQFSQIVSYMHSPDPATLSDMDCKEEDMILVSCTCGNPRPAGKIKLVLDKVGLDYHLLYKATVST